MPPAEARQLILIGRAPEDDGADAADLFVTIDDASLSRRHAELVRAGRLLHLSDRASRNGTALCGPDGRWRPLRQDAVSPEDVVRLGRVTARVADLLAAARPAGGGGGLRFDPERGVPIGG